MWKMCIYGATNWVQVGPWELNEAQKRVLIPIVGASTRVNWVHLSCMGVHGCLVALGTPIGGCTFLYGWYMLISFTPLSMEARIPIVELIGDLELSFGALPHDESHLIAMDYYQEHVMSWGDHISATVWQFLMDFEFLYCWKRCVVASGRRWAAFWTILLRRIDCWWWGLLPRGILLLGTTLWSVCCCFWRNLGTISGHLSLGNYLAYGCLSGREFPTVFHWFMGQNHFVTFLEESLLIFADLKELYVLIFHCLLKEIQFVLCAGYLGQISHLFMWFLGWLPVSWLDSRC